MQPFSCSRYVLSDRTIALALLCLQAETGRLLGLLATCCVRKARPREFFAMRKQCNTVCDFIDTRCACRLHAQACDDTTWCNIPAAAANHDSKEGLHGHQHRAKEHLCLELGSGVRRGFGTESLRTGAGTEALVLHLCTGVLSKCHSSSSPGIAPSPVLEDSRVDTSQAGGSAWTIIRTANNT